MSRFEVVVRSSSEAGPEFLVDPDRVLEASLDGVAVTQAKGPDGETRVAFKVKHADGRIAVVQTSPGEVLFLAAVVREAMRQFGEPWPQ